MYFANHLRKLRSLEKLFIVITRKATSLTKSVEPIFIKLGFHLYAYMSARQRPK